MRIGIDARFYTSAATGIGRYVYELVTHLLKIDGENEYTIFLNAPQFEAFTPSRKGVKKVLADAHHYSVREQWHFWRLLEAAHLDVMHFTHFNAPFFYRKSSVVTIHDLTLHLYPGSKMSRWWQRAAYHITINSIARRAKKIIAVSENTKKDVIRFLHAASEKIEVLHLGVNDDFHKISDEKIIENFRTEMGLTKPYLLYTGVWRSHKNLVNLIKAFSILKRRHNFGGWLVITGKEDPWYPEVKQTVKEEHLEGEVRFTGLVPDEDLILLNNAALMYVFPSLYEGFGLPALEAFACGVPVCAANASSLPEICGKDNAIFFDPKNPQDIAEKIASVYTDPQKMKTLSERGLKRVKDFSWTHNAEQTLKIYQDVYALSKTHS